MKEELNEEQERADDLEDANETLKAQITSLKTQLAQYIADNDNQREVRYDQAKLEQLLQDKTAELAKVEDELAKSQEKVGRLRDQLEQSKQLLKTETSAHQQLQREIQSIRNEYDTSIESYKAQLDKQRQIFEDLQMKYRYIFLYCIWITYYVHLILAHSI